MSILLYIFGVTCLLVGGYAEFVRNDPTSGFQLLVFGLLILILSKVWDKE